MTEDNKKTIEVPINIIENIIHYCEFHQIYDKLTNFDDFYYKLKQLL